MIIQHAGGWGAVGSGRGRGMAGKWGAFAMPSRYFI